MLRSSGNDTVTSCHLSVLDTKVSPVRRVTIGQLSWFYLYGFIIFHSKPLFIDFNVDTLTRSTSNVFSSIHHLVLSQWSGFLENKPLSNINTEYCPQPPLHYPQSAAPFMARLFWNTRYWQVWIGNQNIKHKIFSLLSNLSSTVSVLTKVSWWGRLVLAPVYQLWRGKVSLVIIYSGRVWDCLQMSSIVIDLFQSSNNHQQFNWSNEYGDC